MRSHRAAFGSGRTATMGVMFTTGRVGGLDGRVETWRSHEIMYSTAGRKTGRHGMTDIYDASCGEGECRGEQDILAPPAGEVGEEWGSAIDVRRQAAESIHSAKDAPPGEYEAWGLAI